MKNKKKNPPFIPYMLLRILLRGEDFYEFTEDIHEVYRYMMGSKPGQRTKAWYWFRVLESIPGIIMDKIYWRFLMFKNYLKISVRNMKRHKGYSFINIAGLAIGMAAFLLISLYVQHELSFDRYHENAGRIFRVIKEEGSSTGNDRSAFIHNALGPAMVEDFPEVIRTARIFRWHVGEKFFSVGDKGLYESLYYADPAFFEIFSIPFLSGNAATALTEPHSIVMSERLARKHYGNKNPVGKILNLQEGSEQNAYKITGVFKDMPENSHLRMDLVTRLDEDTLQAAGASHTYVLLSKGSDPERLEQKLPALVNKHDLRRSSEENADDRYFLQPMTSIHLHSHLSDNTQYSDYSDIKYIYIYSSIALLILVVVCLNYWNLSAARSFQRFKEVGIRKVVGADRRVLIKQFLGESLLVTILALAASVVLVVMFLPVFKNIIGVKLSLDQMGNIKFFLVIVLAVIFVGIVGGGYPALHLSSFRPSNILKGTSKNSLRGNLLRNILVITQFSIAIIIIISTLAIKHQINFINKKDMGFDREQILVLSKVKYHEEIRGNEESIKTELKRNPNITAVSCSADLPNSIISRGRIDLLDKNTGEPVPFNIYTVDHDFVALYGMEIVQGRNFLRDFHSDSIREVLINETAAKVIEEESLIGKEFNFWGSQTGRVIGVVRNFHSRPLRYQIPPTFIALYPEHTNYISIKINTVNIPETIYYIKGTMKKFAPHYEFDYHFFDEIFDRDYQNERMMGKIFSYFMLLSIIIACMGLIGISTLSAEQRIKEIGIRKVLGASIPGIVGLLSRDFTKCVLFANIIAWPVAYFIMHSWLQNFAYRVNLGIGIFILSGLAALAIALITVSYQTIKAATANPVDSLRYE